MLPPVYSGQHGVVMVDIIYNPVGSDTTRWTGWSMCVLLHNIFDNTESGMYPELLVHPYPSVLNLHGRLCPVLNESIHQVVVNFQKLCNQIK